MCWSQSRSLLLLHVFSAFLFICTFATSNCPCKNYHVVSDVVPVEIWELYRVFCLVHLMIKSQNILKVSSGVLKPRGGLQYISYIEKCVKTLSFATTGNSEPTSFPLRLFPIWSHPLSPQNLLLHPASSWHPHQQFPFVPLISFASTPGVHISWPGNVKAQSKNNISVSMINMPATETKFLDLLKNWFPCIYTTSTNSWCAAARASGWTKQSGQRSQYLSPQAYTPFICQKLFPTQLLSWIGPSLVRTSTILVGDDTLASQWSSRISYQPNPKNSHQRHPILLCGPLAIPLLLVKSRQPPGTWPTSQQCGQYQAPEEPRENLTWSAIP
jgi:hypothetical protein